MLAESPAHLEALGYLDVVPTNHGHPKDAMTHRVGAFEIDPGWIRAGVQSGRALVADGRHAEAIPML